MGLVSVRVVVSVILPLIERLTNVVRAGRGYYNLGSKVTATRALVSGRLASSSHITGAFLKYVYSTAAC